MASQSLLKAGFRNASHVDVFSEVFSMGGSSQVKISAKIIGLACRSSNSGEQNFREHRKQQHGQQVDDSRLEL